MTKAFSRRSVLTGAAAVSAAAVSAMIEYFSWRDRQLPIFDVGALVEFISRVMTLYPGDVIMTGTPAGPPQLQPGDVCEIEIEGLGVLRNSVVQEDEATG